MATPGDWPFGQFLDRWVKESGRTVAEIGELAGVSDRRIHQLIEGFEWRGGQQIPVRATKASTVRKLQAVLGFPLNEALELAGLPPAPTPPPAGEPSPRDYTIQQLLADIGQRFHECMQEIELPDAHLRPEQLDSRGELVALLDGLAGTARKDGDVVAATAIGSLARRLNDQLIEAAAHRETNGAPAQS